MQSTGYRRRVRSRPDTGAGNVIEGQRIYCIAANDQGAPGGTGTGTAKIPANGELLTPGAKGSAGACE